jgi:hypothetical protein
MTLAQRHALIDRAVHSVSRAFPCASNETLFDLASATLAREHGLVVTPTEIERVLSQLAEAAL